MQAQLTEMYPYILNICIQRECTYTVVYPGFRGWGGGPGRIGGGNFFTLEKSNISRFFKLENFQKMFKKAMKN